MNIRPNFVAYECFGAWDTLTNELSHCYYEAVYIDQSAYANPENCEFWDEYAYTFKCNESFWYVQ